MRKSDALEETWEDVIVKLEEEGRHLDCRNYRRLERERVDVLKQKEPASFKAREKNYYEKALSSCSRAFFRTLV